MTPRPADETGWNGLLLIDKPPGPTSHDVVDRIRRETGQRRVGHAGTLDPLASGLLPLVLGRATRLVRFLPHSPKCYEGELLLGLTTLTDDTTGEVLQRHEGPPPSAERVRAAVAGLLGAQLQVPPAVSARKVGGKRLYRLARQGVRVEAPPSMIEVHEFRVEPLDDDVSYRFHVRVSGGTYVRGMIRDLGATLGCGGVLASLRRSSIASMTPSPSLRLSPVASLGAPVLAANLIPPEEMPLAPPPLGLAEPDELRRFLSGASIAVDPAACSDGPCRVLDPQGRLLGVAEKSGSTLRPHVVLRAERG